MQVIIPLVFREMFGIMQFPDVVVKRRSSRVIDVLPDRRRTRFRKLRHHHGMVIRTGRFFFELFQKFCVRARKLAKPKRRQAVEGIFVDRQHRKENDGGHHAPEQAVTKLREQARPTRGKLACRNHSFGLDKFRDLQKEDDKIDRNDDKQTDFDNA